MAPSGVVGVLACQPLLVTAAAFVAMGYAAVGIRAEAGSGAAATEASPVAVR